MPQLIAPDVRVHESFLAAVAEFRVEGREPSHPDSETADDFAAYVETLRAWARAHDLPAGYVPHTTLWWVDGTSYLGRISIRHELIDHLRDVGGHIGYEVRPSARRKGHATAMLRAALPIAHDLGIESVLITCDVDNVASRKVIEANGGVFDDERHGKLRYWVATGP